MQNLRLKYLIVVVLFFLHKNMFSQNYPIQITTLLTPPFSGYLTDYTAIGAQNLKLIVIFNDFTKPSYNIKLKFNLSGQNINIESKNYYFEGPFTLIPGVPLEITGSEIAGLLNSNNLDFSGLSKQQYESGKVLPEGLYTICFTAYDFDNPLPIQVSNLSCFNCWMMLNDPPFLNFPACGSIQTAMNPQNIIFQWTSMNLLSPNSFNNTNYEFSLYEIRPKGANPNNILQTLPPIFQTTLNTTTFNYGLTEPVLNAGMDYVWRVKSIDLTGRDFFKNNGYSQYCTFTYGSISELIDSSSMALTLNGNAINYRTAKCYWDTLNIYKGYNLFYRKQNATNWFSNNNINISHTYLQNLEANNTYEAYLKGILIDNNEGPASNTITIVTPAKTDYYCGQYPNTIITQNNPLLNAEINQLWEIGQFEILITHLQNRESPIGKYSGYGKIQIPFLGNKNFKVKFNNVMVNNLFQIYSGSVDIISEGIDAWLHNIAIKEAEENAIYINGTISNFTLSNGQYCYSLEGNNNLICEQIPNNTGLFVVRDNNGNQFNIQLNPPPQNIEGPINYFNFSNDSLDSNDSLLITFKESINQKYGFDKKVYAEYYNNYEIIKLKNNKNYFVPNKSIGKNETDEVLAEISINNFIPELLSFKTQNGTNLNSTNVDLNTFKILNLPSNTECIYAWYNNKKVGKLNICSYKLTPKKLVIIPVNNTSISLNSNELNDIFKQSNVTWSVSSAQNFTFNLGADGLEAADATLFNKYSQEMRNLKNAYLLFDSLYDKNAYYLFVVPKFTNPEINGYMVRGRSLGFIKEDCDVKKIAHELAHGAFALEHTFPKIAKNGSNNLMDYNNGIQLIKYQWDKIVNTNFSYSWFDDEEDAAISTTQTENNISIFETLKEIKRCYNLNSTMSITKFNDSRYNGLRTTNAFVGGIKYDYIFIYKDLGSNTQKTSISPKNNISSEEKMGYYVTVGNVPYGLIKIDNAFYVEVPANRRINMENYLKTAYGKNLLLFVNGYRSNSPSIIEKPNSTNNIYTGDVYGYWSGLDAMFMNRIGTKNAVYADGHHSVSTSNHLTQAIFLLSLESSINPVGQTFLNTYPNIQGFKTRFNYGKIAGYDLIQKINTNNIVFDKNTDTLDIVAHSMGYAYALGIVNALNNKGIKFGRFYILAPENACSGGTDWTKFTEVWQYGSNLGQPNADPLNEQDGVAPQCECTNLIFSNNQLNSGNNKNIKTGRVFIPNNVTTKGFIGSHSINNYEWIFNKQKNEGGYVKPR